MQIIDSHTHIRLDHNNSSQGVKNLLNAMRAARIDKAAVFAAPISGLSTESVLAQTESYQDKLFVVGSISPVMPAFIRSIETVEEWLKGGRVKALKFYTGYEHFYPADDRLRPYLELLIKYNLPAIFHMGDLYNKAMGTKLKYAHPLAVDDLAAEMPYLKIVIAHLGSPWVLDAAQVCYKNKNVYADCSGFVYGGFNPAQTRRFAEYWKLFDEIMEGKASEKILFGSDWPISNMISYINVVSMCADKATYDGSEEIFSKNAKHVFNL